MFAFHGLVFKQYKLVFKPRDCLNDLLPNISKVLSFVWFYDNIYFHGIAESVFQFAVKKH